MDVQRVIGELNKLLSMEYAGAIQYLQHSFLVHGLYRESYKGFFRSRSEGSMEHAKTIGEKIVALGGVPTVEPATIRQSEDLEEMLRQNLEFETKSLGLCKELLKLVQDDVPLRVMVENFCLEEQEHVEELEKMLSKKGVSVGVKEIKPKKTVGK